MTERQKCLTLTLTLTAAAMARNRDNRALLLHGLSLFALGLAGGKDLSLSAPPTSIPSSLPPPASAKLESPVIVSVTTASCAVLQRHTSDEEIVLWGCKVLAQLAGHGI